MSKFNYPKPDEPMLAELRKAAGISLHSKGSFENALEVAGYAHTLFTHDGDNTPSSFDALTILREAKAGNSFRCVEYSILAQGLLWAYGIPARVVGLKTADVETRKYGAGHVVVEFWSNKKWVMCDVQWGIVPSLHGEPLSAFEFGQVVKGREHVVYKPVIDSRFRAGQAQQYTDWVAEYLHFYDTDLDVLHSGPYTDLATACKLMLVPEGVPPPKMFQGLFEMNLAYTVDSADFYPPYTV